MEILTAAGYTTHLESLEAPALYAMPWWLDAVCGAKDWQAVIVYDEKQAELAMMPFYQTRLRGLSAIITPPLTQWLPVVSLKPGSSVSLDQIISPLPETQILDIAVQAMDNRNFSQRVSVRYSYILPPESSLALVRAKYNEGLRRNLRAAHDSYQLTVSADTKLFLELYKASHHQQGIVSPKWADTVIPAVYDHLIRYQSGQLVMAYHQQEPIAGILVGWDRNSSYYLAGGKVSGDQGASAHALLLDKAIENAMENGRTFDFEGSMHPGIANFFQSFGASPRPYWHTRRYMGFGRLGSMLRK